MDWFFSSIVKLWGQLICDANLLAQAGKTLSWPSSWKRGKGESKIIWTWRLKVSFTATSSSSQRQTFLFLLWLHFSRVALTSRWLELFLNDVNKWNRWKKHWYISYKVC